MAFELKVPVSVVMQMSVEEFDGWSAYMSWKAEREKKALKQAKAKRKMRG